MNDRAPTSLPPSGPWSGYYTYGPANSKHRMHLQLVFAPDGNVSGDGIDDIALFTIDGVFDIATNQARWTKSYVGMHSVDYHGFYDQRSICGNWTLMMGTGGFWIWPRRMEETDGIETEVEQPVAEVVG